MLSGFFLVLVASLILPLNSLSVNAQPIIETDQTPNLLTVTKQQIQSESDEKKLAKTSLPFIQNDGQLDKTVTYYANTFAGSVFVTNDGLTYALGQKTKSDGIVMKESFSGMVLHPTGLEKSDSVVNYMVGDKDNWRNNIPTYDEIALGQVWPYVDVSAKAYGKNIEKIFTVLPGGNIDDIQVSFVGIKSLSINPDGQLSVNTDLGPLSMTKPVAYQEIDGVKKLVNVSYVVDGNKYGFSVGDYDKNYSLIIDPLLGSTFLGGSNSDQINSIAVDGARNVFVTGYTGSLEFPTTVGAFNQTLGLGGDAFVSKFNPDLTKLISSTFIGGDSTISTDDARSIAIDGTGNVYITGDTSSVNYPTTPGAYKTTISAGGSDGFISKFDNTLSTLLDSTFIGGTSSDIPTAISISGGVYITGVTSSSNFPTTIGAYNQTYGGGNDVFVSELNTSLSSLTASTFIGGSDTDTSYAMAVDGTGNIFVTGETRSADFPTTLGAYDRTYNGAGNGRGDAFVSKLNPTLSSLTASTFLGGSDGEEAHGIVTDGTGNVFVTGFTYSSNFPTTAGAYDQTFNGGLSDIFVSKFTNSLSSLTASTFIGGSNTDISNAITIDNSGNVYVTGWTGSSDYPTTAGANDQSYHGTDVIVSKLDNSLSSLTASTFIGGSNADVANSIFYKNTKIYLGGITTSADYPTTFGAFNQTYSGGLGMDSFVSILTSDLGADHTGSIEFDQLRYTSGNTATVTVIDPDLNLDPSLVDIYTVVSSGADPAADTVGIAGEGVSGGTIPIGTITGIYFDSPGSPTLLWKNSSTEPVACATQASATFDGLKSTGFSIVETGANTGIFSGTFDIPDKVCVKNGASFSVVPTDGSIPISVIASYEDHRDATGNVALIKSTSFIALPQTISFDLPSYTVNHDAATITVTDSAADTNASSVDTVSVLVDSTSDPAGIPVTLTETGANTGIFRGSLVVSSSPSSSAVPSIKANGGDQIKATYTSVSSTASILPDVGVGILSSTTFPIVIDPLVIYPESHGAIRVTDTTSWNSGVSSITAHISSTVSTTGFDVLLTRDTTNSGSYTSNMITFTAQSGAVANSVTLVLPIPGVATPSAVTATYGQSRVTADVLLPPVSQVVVNPVTTVGLACAAGDDRDNDGICDSWETSSGLVIPYNGIIFSIPPPGQTCHTLYDGTNDPLNANLCPDPTKPDIYVQVSWMDGHRPDPTALGYVVNAFRNAPVTSPLGATGINLHILVDQNPMPFTESIPLDSGLADKSGFRQLKSQYFMTSIDKSEIPSPLPSMYTTTAQASTDIATAKRQVFHYAAYIHNLSDAPFSSGWSEINGNDFIVSLGNFTGQVGSINQQSGTFMHELGHNLNLNHGGPGSASFNCKPPYLTVMNYLYQFNAANGGFMVTRPLDYSHSRISYDENLLDEQGGIPASVPPGLNAAIAGINSNGAPLSPRTVPTGMIPSGATSWPDFNQNGVRETATYAQNTHYFGIPDCTDTSIRLMGGSDDWHSLVFNFRTSSMFANGVYTNPHVENEINGTIVKQIFKITGATPDPPSPITVAPIIYFNNVNQTFNGNTISIPGYIDDPISKSFTGVVDFGDGSGSQPLGITGKDFTLTHTYKTVGNYSGNVAVTNNRNGNAVTYFDIDVFSHYLVSSKASSPVSNSTGKASSPVSNSTGKASSPVSNSTGNSGAHVKQ